MILTFFCIFDNTFIPKDPGTDVEALRVVEILQIVFSELALTLDMLCREIGCIINLIRFHFVFLRNSFRRELQGLFDSNGQGQDFRQVKTFALAQGVKINNKKLFLMNSH